MCWYSSPSHVCMGKCNSYPAVYTAEIRWNASSSSSQLLRNTSQNKSTPLVVHPLVVDPIAYPFLQAHMLYVQVSIKQPDSHYPRLRLGSRPNYKNASREHVSQILQSSTYEFTSKRNNTCGRPCRHPGSLLHLVKSSVPNSDEPRFSSAWCDMAA